MGRKCRCNPPVEAVQRTVRKEGPNTGKQFWCCSRSACKYFEWDSGAPTPARQFNPNNNRASTSTNQNSFAGRVQPPTSFYRNNRGGRGRGGSNNYRGRGRGRSASQSAVSFGTSRQSSGPSPFARTTHVRPADGTSTSPQDSKRIKITPSNATKNNPIEKSQRTLSFELAGDGSVKCKVNPMWMKNVIEALQSIQDVKVSEKAVAGMKEIMVPFKDIKSARQILSDQVNMRMEFSFPFEIVERLQMLNAAHEDRERKGDTVTQALNEILPVSICDKLMPFQWEGVNYALSHGGRVLIGDDMGLGKTLQAIAVARIYMQDWPLLVICPSSLRLNWKEELLRWLEDEVTKDDILVIMTGKDTDLPFRKINIVSYDLIWKVRQSKLDRCGFLIADESHYMKTRTAKRTKFVTPLVKKAKRALLLSGTPALSRPVELFTQANALVPVLFPDYTEYVERYCNAHHGRFGYDVSGSSNLEELHTLLRASVLIRRKKDDVLTQLPAKRRQVIWVEAEKSYLTKIKKTFKVLERLRDQSKNCAPDAAIQFKQAERAKRTELYMNSGMAKIKAVNEFVKDTADTGCKFIVFAHHQAVMDSIAEYMSTKLKIEFIRIDGETSQSSRQGLCRSFQEMPKIRVALLSITAAGVGLTLTAATVVLFAELYWNPGSLLQAEDRAHRIGQRDCVLVKYLLAKSTYDESVWSTVQRKFNVIGKSLTGAAATIEVASQTPDKITENAENIRDFDDEVAFIAHTDTQATATPDQKRVSRKIDLTQEDDDDIVDEDVCIVLDDCLDVKSPANPINTSSMKESKPKLDRKQSKSKKAAAVSSAWDKMFPDPGEIINVDDEKNMESNKLLDADHAYVKKMRREVNGFFK